MVCRAPRNGWNDDFIASLKRPVLFVEESGDRDEIRGGPRIHHHAVAHSEVAGEFLLKERHFLAHRKTSAGDGSADRFDLFRSPGGDSKLVKHNQFRCETTR